MIPNVIKIINKGNQKSGNNYEKIYKLGRYLPI